MNTGAIILCGGKSRRMTVDKASLPFGDELLLQRVIRICSQVLHPLVVVAADGQELPDVGAHVRVVRDQRQGRGPLEGIATGLTEMATHADAAYITSCDVPFLRTSFIEFLVSRISQHDIVVPFDQHHHHPLAAVYRTRVLAPTLELLADDRMRPLYLFDAVDTLQVPTTELRAVDPHLDSLTNLNHPDDYFSALATAGLTIPNQLRQRLQSRAE